VDGVRCTLGLGIQLCDRRIDLGLRQPLTLQPGLDCPVAPPSLGQRERSPAREPGVIHEPGFQEGRDGGLLRVGSDATALKALPQPPFRQRPRSEGTDRRPQSALAPEFPGERARERAVERKVHPYRAAHDDGIRDRTPRPAVELDLDAAGRGSA
jgi:hypothetical protein